MIGCNKQYRLRAVLIHRGLKQQGTSIKLITGLRAVLIHRGLKLLLRRVTSYYGLRAVLIHRGLKLIPDDVKDLPV